MAVKVGTGFSGKLKLFDKMIGYQWKGLQVFRNETKKIQQVKSEARSLINSLVPELTSRWFEVLTQEQRFAWDQFAGMLNSAAKEDSDRQGNGAKNIIPSRRKLMSGFNAYLRSNLLGASRGATIPRDRAPLDVVCPTPPLNVSVTYTPATGIVEVTWSDPDVSMYPVNAEVYVSVWAMVIRRKKVHPQLIVAYPVPSPQSATFSSIRTGHSWDSPILPIKSFSGGFLVVQMDTITSGEVPPTDKGFIPSPPSSTATTIIART